MDSDDAEARKLSGDAVVRESSGRGKFAALLLIHSLLTGVCVVLSFYTFRKPSESTPIQVHVDKGIYLNMKNETTPLQFTVTWKSGLELKDDTAVKVTFPGPYVFYIWAKLHILSGSKCNLIMKQGNSTTSIELQHSPVNGLRYQRLVSLFENDVVTFNFNFTNTRFQVKGLRVGLHYLLGAHRFDTPK